MVRSRVVRRGGAGEAAWGVVGRGKPSTGTAGKVRQGPAWSGADGYGRQTHLGTNKMKLRPYQRQALNALYSFWRKQGGNPLIVLPTGSGKSLVMAALCQELLRDYPNLRIGIVTHVRELIKQNFDELMSLWPLAPAGIFSAGIGRRDTRDQILFCGIQSVWNKTDLVGLFDIILIDEVHLVSKNSATMYGAFIAAVRAAVPDVRIVGLTASPWRLDSGRLDRGKGRIFDKVVFDANVRNLIDQGYLCNLMSKATATALDVSNVGQRGGEFIAGELEIAVDQDWITQAAVREIIQYSRGRKSWLVFCSGVAHAAHVRDEMVASGIKCETVTGDTPKELRDAHIRNFKLGKLQCLTSVGVLGTGFNHPGVDLIALLRPTQSAGLFLQQVGRGLRNAPNKKNCLILDFAGNTSRHGPIDMITISHSSERRGDGEALVKACPQCRSILPLACKTCPDCGYVFSDDSLPAHEATADAKTPILSQGAPVWINVNDVQYFQHLKPGSVPTLRIEYLCGLLVHKQWACFDHSGLARSKAEHWWRKAGGDKIPRSTAEALARAHELNKPAQIQIRPDGKYFVVVGWKFNAAEAAKMIA